MKKKVLKIGKILGVLLVVVLLIGFVYLNMNTYEPMDEAIEMLDSPQVKTYDDYYVVEPVGDVLANLVYYQGGLVETASYLPFAKLLADEGIRVVIPKMPFNLAIINSNAFYDIEEELIEDLPILIAGHSLGGASASLFLGEEKNIIDGLIFLGSYPAGSADLSGVSYDVMSIVGTRDGGMNWETYEQTKMLLPSDTIYVELMGGNHAQFGHYGPQKGDLPARISRENQQAQTVDLIVLFITNMG